jgi:hypothetical protein
VCRLGRCVELDSRGGPPELPSGTRAAAAARSEATRRPTATQLRAALRHSLQRQVSTSDSLTHSLLYSFIHSCSVSCREFLAHFAGPLLLDVLREIRAAAAARLSVVATTPPIAGGSGSGGASECDSVEGLRPNVTIFSGHDVNILGMLFALNAVMDDAHWPSYGTAVAHTQIHTHTHTYIHTYIH